MFRTPLRAVALASLSALAFASAPATAVEPFSADYAANYMGMQADGTMTLTPAGANRWKYSLEVSGAGARLAQSTVFEADGDRWRPISGNDSQGGENGLAAMLVKKRSVNATYDWGSGQATWDGDVKPDRRGPVKLHLSEHRGDATTGSAIFVWLSGVDAYHRELAASAAGFALPEIADQPWGREIGLVDPFGNRLRFCERPATG